MVPALYHNHIIFHFFFYLSFPVYLSSRVLSFSRGQWRYFWFDQQKKNTQPVAEKVIFTALRLFKWASVWPLTEHLLLQNSYDASLTLFPNATCIFNHVSLFFLLKRPAVAIHRMESGPLLNSPITVEYNLNNTLRPFSFHLIHQAIWWELSRRSFFWTTEKCIGFHEQCKTVCTMPRPS